ncbi:MAG: hypothetical protein HOE79_02490 [Euryarchaeota archaeon]|nr:hypothetical protein [Euryarchaeota archaeon]
MSTMRVKTTLILCLLLLATNLGAAESGGVGDGVYDMQCGGACHGDSDQNATSSASLILTTESHIYAGQATTFSLQVESLTSSPYAPIGLFLLSDTTGYRDTPQDIGWQILSDSKGDVNNYIEISGLTDGDTIDWVLRAPEIGNYTFYASIQHGGNNAPHFGISQAYTVEVLPIPDNLPRLTEEFTPIVAREVGQVTKFQLSTEDADTVVVEWRIDGGVANQAIVTGDAVNGFMVELPTANQPSTMQWRAVLDGEGPQQTSPWFTLVTNEQGFSIDETAVYLQAISVLIFFAGLTVLLQTRNRTNQNKEEKSFDEITSTVSQEGGEL